MFQKLRFGVVLLSMWVLVPNVHGQATPTQPAQPQTPSAQGSPAKAKKQHYLIRLVPVDLEQLIKPNETNAKHMKEHFTLLQKHAREGKVVVAGPSINGPDTFGIVIVEVESEAEARAMLDSDPAVINKLMKGEVLPFNLAIERSR